MSVALQKSLYGEAILRQILDAIKPLEQLPVEEKIELINQVKRALHEVSPFKDQPVDCVVWVPNSDVFANDYNPNSVAPPEMKLLERSISEDGYTQPVVTWDDEGRIEVIDGFHRNRVGKECKAVREKVMGYLPIVVANSERTDKGDRIAATIRHNRARGKHQVAAMSDIVIELKRRNWTDEKIARELGMDADEVLRLTQITGLAEMFQNQEFSKSWDIEFDGTEIVSEVLSDSDPDFEPKDKGRKFHTWEKWECYRHGFYEEKPEKITQEQGEERYREFLSDLSAFENALIVVTSTWKFSCEHYLTNERMNRIAWLGQAAVAQALRIPSCCRGGYNALTEAQKKAADELALKYLNIWLIANGYPEASYDQALSRTEAELY